MTCETHQDWTPEDGEPIRLYLEIDYRLGRAFAGSRDEPPHAEEIEIVAVRLVDAVATVCTSDRFGRDRFTFRSAAKLFLPTLARLARVGDESNFADYRKAISDSLN